MCVRICRFSKEGLSNLLPHTSHGKRFLSPRGARGLGGATIVVSIRSPVLLAPDDDVYDSPEMDLRSSSVTGDEEGGKTSAIRDIDKSSGESKGTNKELFFSWWSIFILTKKTFI